jgi:RHS repeat-associated protein
MQTQKLSAILKKLLTSVLILSFTFSSFPFDAFGQERTLDTGSHGSESPTQSEPQTPEPRETKPEGESITHENPTDTRPEEHKPEHPELDLPSVDNDAPRPDEETKDERGREGGVAGEEEEAPLQPNTKTEPKLTVSESTGALQYSYPIELPQARGNYQPSLALTYDSRNYSKPDSFVGLGWDLPILEIKREPYRGTNNLYTEKFFSSSMSGNILPTQNSSDQHGYYKAQNDGGDFLEYQYKDDSSWKVTDKQGTTYYFGETAASRQDDPNDSSRIYRWMVSRVVDTNGNETKYSYMKDSGQIYPSKVEYNSTDNQTSITTIDFTYTSAQSVSGTESIALLYNTGFPVYIKKFIQTLAVKTITPGEFTRTDTYTFDISSINAFIDDSAQKNLAAITQVSRLGSSSTSIISRNTVFTYSKKIEDFTTDGHTIEGFIPSYIWPPLDFGNLVTADFDGNGYSDILISEFEYNDEFYFSLLLNDGEKFVESHEEWDLPSAPYGHISQIVDINGDNLPDIYPNAFTSGYPGGVFINTGTKFVHDTSGTWTINGILPNYSTSCSLNAGGAASATHQSNIFLLDMNQDGLNDVVNFGGTGSNFKVFLNNGNGWDLSDDYEYIGYPGEPAIHDVNCHNYPNPNAFFEMLQDVNGDSLPDYFNSTVQGVYLNTGKGFKYSTTYKQYIERIYPLSFADINNDGLLDYATRKTGGGESDKSCVFLNTGKEMPSTTECFGYSDPELLDNFWDPSQLKFGYSNPESYGILLDISSKGFPDIVAKKEGVEGFVRDINNQGTDWYSSAGYGLLSPPAYTKYADFNSDNIVDFISKYTTSGNFPLPGRIAVGHPAVPNRLISITTPFNTKTDIEYGTAPTNGGGINIAPMSVVKNITTKEVSTNKELSSTSYSYDKGLYEYDPVTMQRPFTGFGKVETTSLDTTDAVINKTATYFHQGNETSSSLGEYNDHISKSGKPYRTEVYDSSGNLKQVSVNKWDRHDFGNGSSFVKLASTLNTTYDTDEASTAEEYTYDNTTGNLTSKKSLGKVEGSNDGTFNDIGNDDITTVTTYSTNATQTISLPHKQLSFDHNSSLLRDTTTLYDSQDQGATFITKGNPTKQTLKDTVSTNLEVKRTFDSYGLPITETDPLGNVTQYEYDSNHLYPTKIKNPLNQETTYTYNYALGKPTEVIDPNGLKQITEYDGLGRVTSQKYSTSTPVTLVTYSYQDTVFPRSVTETKYLTQTNQATSITYLDGLGRTIQTRREMEDSNKYSVTDTIYDQLGRKSKESLPYESTGTAYTQPSSNTSLYITYSYDALNRITKISNILGDTTNTYNGFTTVTTDAEGNKKDFTKDAYGNLTEVKEHNNTETYSTTYTYSPLGHLTKITDAEGNVRNFTYDLLGKRIKDEDLHKPTDTTYGIRSFTYDKAGNMISEKNAEGITTIYTYDKLNRPLTQRKLPVTMTDEGNYLLSTEDSISTYDTCLNGKGRVCAVTTKDGSVSYEYDALGRKTKETKVIKGETFTETFSYDRAGNLTEKTLPDTTKYSQTFNTAGLLEATSVKKLGEQAFTPVALDFDYSPEGKITYNKNSDNTESIYTYDSNALYRLKAKVTRNTAPLESFTGGSTTTVFQVTEDGHVKAQPGNALWPIKHPDTTGMNVDNVLNASLAEVNVQNFNSGVIELTRSFFSFDTSSLPDNAYIESANLKLYTIDRKDDLNDGLGWVNIYEGKQASATTLVNADINDCGTVLNPVALSTNKLMLSTPISTTTSFILNATGTSVISKTAHTKLCMREGHDASFTYVPQGTSLKYSYYKFATKNHTTAAWRPTLEVTWSTEAPPPPPPDGNLQNLNYTYDKLGNITKLEELADGDLTRSVTYTYDDLNRLTSATAKNLDNTPIYSESYTYSPVGNILTTTSMDGVVGTRTYHYDTTDYANPHAVTRIVSPNETITLNYDKNGNLLTDGKNTYTFDQRNRLLSAKNKEGITTFTYDHTGQRTSLTTYPSNSSGPSATYYPSDSYNKEVKEDASVTHTIHLSAGDALSATLQRTSPSDEEIGTIKLNFLHTDHLGGSSVITNNGSVIESTDYYPYGTIRVDELAAGSLEEQKKFTGHEYDEETGLTYMNARYYSSNVGRFVSQDPLFFALGDRNKVKEMTGKSQEYFLMDPQQLNSYSYVANNPMKNVDKNGEFLDTIVDVGFIAYDIYKITQAVRNGESVSEHVTALGLDVAGALIPGVTGLGMVSRAAGKVDDVVDGVKVLSKADNFAHTDDLVNKIDLHGSYEKHVLGDLNPHGKEYGSLFQSKEQWSGYLKDTINNPSSSFSGPTKDLYWDDRLGTVIINNKTGGPPTAFHPQQGKQYYLDRVAEQKSIQNKKQKIVQ